MSTSSGKKGPPKGRVHVTYFEKPADRTKTLLETPAISAPETIREMPAIADGGKRSSRGGRRTTTLEAPIVEVVAELPQRRGKPSRSQTPVPGRRSDWAGINRHGAKTLGEKQLAQMALYGHGLFEKGKLREARTIFEGLVEIGVDDAFPHTMLGILFLMDGDADGALALFEAALAIDPTDPAARVYRAEIRLSQGGPEAKRALSELEAVAEEAGPGDPFGARARKLLQERSPRRDAPTRRGR